MYGLAVVIATIAVVLLWKGPGRSEGQIGEGAMLRSADEAPRGHAAGDSPALRSPRTSVDHRSIARVPGRNAAVIPLPPLDAPLRAIYPELKERADDGDSRAQCRLAFELHRCEMAPMLIDAAGEYRDRVLRTDPNTPEGRSAREIWAWRQGLADKARSACEGFTPHKGIDAWRYELASALGGNPAATIRFLSGFELHPNEPLASLDGWMAYRDDGAVLLQRAIDAGYPQAYEFAAFLSLRPMPLYGLRLVPHDRVQAAAYSMALMTAVSPASRQEIQAGLDGMHLGDADLAEASARAAPLAAKLRSTGGPVDFTRGIFPHNDGRECED